MVRLGIDLGGTNITGARLDGDAVTAEAKQPTPTAGPESVADAIVAVVAEVGGADGADGIGIGAPGLIDHDAGTVIVAPNLRGFDTPVPLARLVSDRLDGARVVLDNDVNVGLLAEHRLGAGRGADDLLGVFVGTGVGGGLVLGGRIRRGAHGGAGEIGHVIVVDEGRPCGCGARGHLEAYAGRAGIESEARRRSTAGEPTALVDLSGAGPMRSKVLSAALDARDPMAMELLDDAVRALGIAVASVVTVLDVDLVVVGGGVADRLGSPFIGRVEQAVRARIFGAATLRVLPAELGDAAGPRGAALLVEEP